MITDMSVASGAGNIRKPGLTSEEWRACTNLYTCKKVSL